VRVAYRFITLLVASTTGTVTLAGCGSGTIVSARSGQQAQSSSATGSPTSTAIGNLVAPDVSDAPTVDSLPPLAQYVVLIPCAQFKAATGEPLYIPGDLPPKNTSATCWVQSWPLNPTTAFSGGVIYVPQGMTTSANSLIDVFKGGGLLVQESFKNGKTSPFPPGSASTDDVNANGSRHAARAKVHGRDAYVNSLIGVSRIGVEWIDQTASGDPVDLFVQGDYSADQMYQIADSVHAGMPTDEYSPPPSYPPAPQQGGGQGAPTPPAPPPPAG
jgi:hypothetical protein